MIEEKKDAVVHAPSSTLTRTTYSALIARGLRDLVTSGDAHNLAIERGEDYYIVRDGPDWRIISDSEVGWEPDSVQPGYLAVPKRLLGRMIGPYFSRAEAERVIEARRKQIELPHVLPHLWMGPQDVAAGLPNICSFCGESDVARKYEPCPKRSWYTWYEVLGISEEATADQIDGSYHRLVAEWNPQRLRLKDDITFDGGYSETQLRWFSAAYAVLGDPGKRRQYDEELRRQRG